MPETSNNSVKSVVNFTKDDFINIIEDFKVQRDNDKKYWDDLCSLLRTDDIPMYNNSMVEKSLYSTLSILFTNEGINLIKYYSGDLDFGRAKGSVMTIDILFDHLVTYHLRK